MVILLGPYLSNYKKLCCTRYFCSLTYLPSPCCTLRHVGLEPPPLFPILSLLWMTLLNSCLLEIRSQVFPVLTEEQLCMLTLWGVYQLKQTNRRHSNKIPWKRRLHNPPILWGAKTCIVEYFKSVYVVLLHVSVQLSVIMLLLYRTSTRIDTQCQEFLNLRYLGLGKFDLFYQSVCATKHFFSNSDLSLIFFSQVNATIIFSISVEE